MKNIVWIASFPKSGNTWFRIFLGNLLSDADIPININNNHINLNGSNRDLIDNILCLHSSDLTENEINVLRPDVYRYIASESHKSIYIKTHDTWKINCQGNEIFPKEVTKGVIYIIRNPFDIVVSLANHYSLSIKNSIDLLNDSTYKIASNPVKLSPQICQHIGNWSEHIQSWIDYSGLEPFVIRYEDMLADPVKYLTGAVRYLGINVTKKQIQESIRYSSLNELKKQEKVYGFREKPISVDTFFKYGTKNHWIDFLNEDDIQHLSKIHEEAIARFNYNVALRS